MDKIINYIKKGSGFGFIFLLAVAVLKTIPIMLELKSVYNDMHPKIMLIAEDFLPIKVENGKIVEPSNAYKRVGLKLGDENSKNTAIPVVLDTRNPVSVVPNEKEGLFIMSDMIYFIADDRIQKHKLKDGFVDKSKFEKSLDATTGLVSLIGVAFFVALFSVGGIIKVIFASLVSMLFFKFMKKDKIYNFKSLTRLGSLLVAMSMLGFENVYISFILVPVVMIFILFKMDTDK